MNDVTRSIIGYYGISQGNSRNECKHYGMPRRSGRYPYGSGENPFQRTDDFIGRVEKMINSGFTYTDPNTGEKYTGEKAVRLSLGLSSDAYRAEVALCKHERRALLVDRAKSLAKDGLTASEIGRIMGKNESSIRSLLNEDAEKNMNSSMRTADVLKKVVSEKGMIDVGPGVEREMGVTRSKLKEALHILEKDGYKVYSGGINNLTNPDKQITQTVLCPPGTEHKDIYNYDQVHTFSDYISYDNGQSFHKAFEYPRSLDSKRLAIKYAEDGGKDCDGLVEIRRGLKDLSLGEGNHYAQVRILVDGTHYIKGMAVYNDDLPPGIDVRFNTNKTKDKSMKEVLKPIKDDPNNPFGSNIKEHGGQYYYTDENGKEQLGLINKSREEGDWSEWKDVAPSQFLAKQSKLLIERQLNIAKDDKKAEFDDIMSIPNPTVRKNLLETFANDCDSAAVHLYAAALPRQKYQVILPVPSMKDTEVYAPNYENGEKLALIRYPHGGTFELPILTVNNKNPDAKKMIGTDSIDAVGINSKIAGILSGADFDGDTVMCIPTRGNGKNLNINIVNREPLPGLVDFDPKEAYPKTEGMRVMGKEYQQKQMGSVSNLIMDMTLAGADDEEVTKAVKHSMVVIDAVKHELDYRRSEKENDIKYLKAKYQGREENGRYTEGASTIITRAKSEVRVDKREGSPRIDPETGKLVYKTARPSKLYKQDYYKTDTKDHKKGELKYNEDGTPVMIKQTTKSTAMETTDDAYTLVSKRRSPQELLYADYANFNKNLANTARKEILAAGNLKYNPEAKKKYSLEVDQLMSALALAELNKPREREAQRIANSISTAKIKANPDMSKEDKKKLKNRELLAAREIVSAHKKSIIPTDKQWEAIEAGAISENILDKILKNSDMDRIRELATPKTAGSQISNAKKARIESYRNNGYTIAQIATALGISTSTVQKYIKKGE